jgi:ribonucleotide reductase beta subunit family protein with ferritin-like domain
MIYGNGIRRWKLVLDCGRNRFIQDLNDWNNKLNDDERYFVETYPCFCAFDGIVNENLKNFVNEVQYAEAKSFMVSNHDGEYSQ